MGGHEAMVYDDIVGHLPPEGQQLLNKMVEYAPDESADAMREYEHAGAAELKAALQEQLDEVQAKGADAVKAAALNAVVQRMVRAQGDASLCTALLHLHGAVEEGAVDAADALEAIVRSNFLPQFDAAYVDKLDHLRRTGDLPTRNMEEPLLAYQKTEHGQRLVRLLLRAREHIRQKLAQSPPPPPSSSSSSSSSATTAPAPTAQLLSLASAKETVALARALHPFNVAPLGPFEGLYRHESVDPLLEMGKARCSGGSANNQADVVLVGKAVRRKSYLIADATVTGPTETQRALAALLLELAQRAPRILRAVPDALSSSEDEVLLMQVVARLQRALHGGGGSGGGSGGGNGGGGNSSTDKPGRYFTAFEGRRPDWCVELDAVVLADALGALGSNLTVLPMGNVTAVVVREVVRLAPAGLLAPPRPVPVDSVLQGCLEALKKLVHLAYVCRKPSALYPGTGVSARGAALAALLWHTGEEDDEALKRALGSSGGGRRSRRKRGRGTNGGAGAEEEEEEEAALAGGGEEEEDKPWMAALRRVEACFTTLAQYRELIREAQGGATTAQLQERASAMKAENWFRWWNGLSEVEQQERVAERVAAMIAGRERWWAALSQVEQQEHVAPMIAGRAHWWAALSPVEVQDRNENLAVGFQRYHDGQRAARAAAAAAAAVAAAPPQPSSSAAAPGAAPPSSSSSSSRACRVAGCTSSFAPIAPGSQAWVYRICNAHAIAPTVVIEGAPKRWCSCCHRFHPLAEFDGPRRSCRTRLDRLASKRNGG